MRPAGVRAHGEAIYPGAAGALIRFARRDKDDEKQLNYPHAHGEYSICSSWDSRLGVRQMTGGVRQGEGGAAHLHPGRHGGNRGRATHSSTLARGVARGPQCGWGARGR